jgi:tetratricopeptide (TPR) repeat protein
MRTRSFRGLGGGIAGLIFLCALAAFAADKTAPIEPAAKPDEAAETQQQQTLRSYLQLQEQLHNTLLTIERTRKEADTAAKANAEAIAARLEAIEQALSAQQSHQANLLVNSNRITLISAGVFAGLGLLAMIFTAWFLVRAMHRLATVAASFPVGHALGGGQAAGFVSADLHRIEVEPGEESGSRLLGVINRLEKKINELEHTSHSALPSNSGSPESAPTNGALESKRVAIEALDRAAETPRRPADPASQISTILKKGQELLDQEKAEDAITCFDEALVIEPRHAEALVKKGTALERLKKLEEAIRCYDQAIAANRSMTLAYLYKGGACNQLERFSEALECYEQALRSQRNS